MGRMTENDCRVLQSIGDRDRANILYLYLVKGMPQKDIAEQVFDNYDDFASQTISVVTRSYGFHGGTGRGRYFSIPSEIIRDFVSRYSPEEYDGGLDEGTFDAFIRSYTRRIEAQRRQEAEDMQEQRRRQAEMLRRREESRLRDEMIRKGLEEDRRQREIERQRLKQEEERQRLEEQRRMAENERRRQAAIAKGEHLRLMQEAMEDLEALRCHDAIENAESSWDIQPLAGSAYILACAYDIIGESRPAAEWAQKALDSCKNDEDKYHKLCAVCVNNNGQKILDCARELLKCEEFYRLEQQGLIYLLSSLFANMFEHKGGIFMINELFEDDLPLAEEAVIRLLEMGGIDMLEDFEQMECAHVLTVREKYEQALQIYGGFTQDNDLYCPFYDLYAHMGKCCYELGDRSSALAFWQDMYAGECSPRPLDALVFNNYQDDLLEIYDTPRVRQDLELADDFLNGRIKGSGYFPRYCGRVWQQAVGLDEGYDCQWFKDDHDNWKFENFESGGSIKGFFGNLFGR